MGWGLHQPDSTVGLNLPAELANSLKVVPPLRLSDGPVLELANWVWASTSWSRQWA